MADHTISTISFDLLRALMTAPGAAFDIPVLPPRPAWMARAACRGVDTAVFFPPRGTRAAEAKAICAGCPVAAECEAYALHDQDDSLQGIWAGTSVQDRAAARMTRGRRAS